MRINTNVGAMAAAKNLGMVQSEVQKSSEKLSSGFRINHASDDAAGLGIANKLRSDIRAYTQASRNAEQANSVYSIADGAAQSVAKMLDRMKELAAQAASDSVDTAGRTRVNAEFQALKSEIDRTVSTVKFQGNALLNGSFGATVTSATALGAGKGGYSVDLNGAAAGTYSITAGGGTVTMTSGALTQVLNLTAASKQALNFTAFGVSLNTSIDVTAASLNATNVVVGAGSGTFLVGASGSYSTNDVLTITGSSLDLTSTTLGINASVTDTLANAQTALTAIDGAISAVNTALGVIGAGQSRVGNALDNLKTVIQNYSAAESTVRDLDMADEMVKFSKNQILAQAGTAMLAQANQSGQGILQLLRG